jgi:hypothetical protein
VGADSDLSRVQQLLLASLEAARATATEASQMLVDNPEVDGTKLAEAVGYFLDTQRALFEVVHEFLGSVEAPPALAAQPSVGQTKSLDTAVEAPAVTPESWADPASPVEVLDVAPTTVTKRTARQYDYFADLRRELADGEPLGPDTVGADELSPAEPATAEHSASTVVTPEHASAEVATDETHSTTSNGTSSERSVESGGAIGEFPDDWGGPREWVDAPLRRLFRRTPKKQQPQAAPQQT